MCSSSMMPKRLGAGALLVALSFSLGCESGDEADSVLRNGNIVTGDEAK